MILFAVHSLLCPAFLPFFPHICKWMNFHEPGKQLKMSASYQGCQTFKRTSCEVVEMKGMGTLGIDRATDLKNFIMAKNSS